MYLLMVCCNNFQVCVLHKNIGEAFRARCRKEGHNPLSQYTQNRLIQNTKDILKMKGITTDAIRSNGNSGLSGITA